MNQNESSTQPARDRLPSVFSLWLENSPRQDWLNMLEDLAEHTFPANELASQARVYALLHEMIPDFPRRSTFEDAIIRFYADALTFAVRFGYALARTWPGSLEEADGWLRAAWEYAGLDEWLARQGTPRPAEVQ